MASDCLFCSIAAGDVAADVVHSDGDVVAFRDIDPQAPTHVLVIPRTHVRDIGAADPQLAASLLSGVQRVVQDLDLNDYRLVFNTGAQAGQSVFHVHAHVLAGRRMAWPPG